MSDKSDSKNKTRKSSSKNVKKIGGDQKDDSAKKFVKIMAEFKGLILPRTDIFDNLD